MTFLLGFLLALAESSLGLGAVLPGEVAITGLSAATDGTGASALLVLAVALGATSGDHLGYLLGHHTGPRLRAGRLVGRLGVARWDRATDLVARHGTTAVLVSRMLPFVRTVMPAVAGAAHLPYRRFLPASVVGALAWASAWVVASSAIAASGVLDHLGTAVVVLAASLAVVLAARHVVRRRRAAGRTLAPLAAVAPVAAVAVPTGGPIDRESTGAHLTGGHPDGGEPGSEELPGSRRPRRRDRLPVC